MKKAETNNKRQFLRSLLGGFAYLIAKDKQEKPRVRPAKDAVVRSKKWDSRL